MTKTPLQQMIDLWEGIAKLHREATFITNERNSEFAAFSQDFREQMTLCRSAEVIIHSLKNYELELNR